jgi:CubicO group peptidase (beta-lactamase class C family)
MDCYRRLLVISAFIFPLFIAPRATLTQAYVYTLPDGVRDGWETASLGTQRINVDPIKELFDRIVSGAYKNVLSVLIARNGKLVVEEYFPRQEGDERERAYRRVAPVEITSATKSVTSILIGIAIDQKLIRGVDEKLSVLLPEYADLWSNDERANLRLKDFLAMCAGLSWDEWTLPYTDARNDHIRMLRSADPLRYILDRPIVAAPGKKFAYNSGISIALGQIILNASGLRADKFAEKHLFEPLGITDFYWSKYPGEIVQTGGGLFLRPRDMAKIGCLFLDSGRWQGKQIVSEDWVKQSITDYVPAGQISEAARADGYGYQWWLGSFHVGGKRIKSFSARGRGGQFILVVPSVQLVAVFTSPPDNPLTFQPLDMMRQYVLPAVLSP